MAEQDWFDNEALWREFYPILFPESRFRHASDQVKQILALTGFCGRDVLDLCCGPGRHAIQFARQGFRVTGVDSTAFLLDEARRRAGEAGVNVEFVLEDMRRFSRPEAFGLAVCLFSSLGYFEDPADDITVLRRLYENLQPGGTLVIDGVGKEPVAKIFQPTLSTTIGNTLYILRSEIVDDWTRVRNEWIRIEGERAVTVKFSQLLYSGQELKDRLHLAGFKDVKLAGDLAGSPYGTQSQRLIAVARK